ncbi:hypothetical protein EGW08_017997 [Elysia chlorotica]|uniref:Uncharacterized protein n=1 Tax=Elysia chlorotica TaxID=188477 RepID=A0A433SY30_ELYCH|nr:hypothetical protein EGW08_017997 [Elysia chlorotica]
MLGGLTHVARRTNPAALRSEVDRAVYDTLGGLSGESATPTLLSFGNQPLSANPDTLTQKVNAVTANKFSEAKIDQKLPPVDFPAIGAKHRLDTLLKASPYISRPLLDMSHVISKHLPDPVLALTALKNHANSGSGIRRDELLLARRPGDEFERPQNVSQVKKLWKPSGLGQRNVGLSSLAIKMSSFIDAARVGVVGRECPMFAAALTSAPQCGRGVTRHLLKVTRHLLKIRRHLLKVRRHLLKVRRYLLKVTRSSDWSFRFLPAAGVSGGRYAATSDLLYMSPPVLAG